MPNVNQHSNFSRYFEPKQKIFLVNMSPGRNGDIYESLSGVVVSSSADLLELFITTCVGLDSTFRNSEVTTYKLTSEALGSGIQVLADLIATCSGNIYKFRMHGKLELFQRRIVPRIELSGRLHHFSVNDSLDVLKSKWERLRNNQHPGVSFPELVMRETLFNLSAGGLGVVLEGVKRPVLPILLVVEFGEGLPVTVLAEPVWSQPVNGRLCCGFRFIHIFKTDQERISNFIRDAIHKNGGRYIDYKRNWVLVDKMVSDVY